VNRVNTVQKQSYAGIFMVALATLMLEILLTRIFSVTMWYHFAFMAVSIAMFGMTVGAIIVYLLPGYFTQIRAKKHLALSSLLFALTIVPAFLAHLKIPFTVFNSPLGWYPIPLTYIIISIPFVFSGICICLALTKFPGQVSRLYAFDLIGAAVGCLLVIYTLKITDGPTAVIIVALLAGIGSILFAADNNNRKLTGIIVISSFLLAALAGAHLVLVHKQIPLLKLKWVKGGEEPPAIFEKWNSFSRIEITGDPNRLERPFGWGFSPTFKPEAGVRQLHLNIDAAAYTPIPAFDGDTSKLTYLKYDITNIAHYLRPDSRVLVVGIGGGRDILSALVFDQKSVVGIEINEDIIKAITRDFGDFTGHLDKDPRVTFVNDEARSYIARQKQMYDIIQVSLIDTWAATASGAFVLTENSLYTLEAWKTFLEHLTTEGVLTFSRWYFRDRPGEIYRLTSLASASLMRLGVKNPRNHIIIIRNMQSKGRGPDGVGTMLVGKSPFSAKDLAVIKEICRDMEFDLVLSPKFALDPIFANIASGKDLDEFTAGFPINIAAPTDDSPFFFQMLRIKDIFNRGLWSQGLLSFNMRAVFILGVLLIVVCGLTFLCIITPLILTTGKGVFKGALPLFIFFSCIGLGFMLVEISQMQRLIIFLGHPIYGLSVVLFALLLSSGLGSYSTQRIIMPDMANSAILRLAFLLCALIIFGVITPHAIRMFQGAETILRILVAVAILFPLGLFMGMAFPLGIKRASGESTAIIPWLWGLNGAASVCASVLAVVIALGSGISISFWTGFLCYLAAFFSFAWSCRRNR